MTFNQFSLKESPYFCCTRAALKMTALLFTLLIAAFAVHAQVSTSTQLDDRPPLVVEGTENGDVFGFGQSVVVRGHGKHGAMSVGGDVIVEGTVEGDVAAIGGSVIQRAGGRIGGDVIVLGGAYHHDESAARDEGKMTIMYAGFEPELRCLMRNPADLLHPGWSPTYLGLRLLAALFWFIISLALTAATPGAISRGVARLQLTNLRVAVIGLVSATVIFLGANVCLYILPTVIGVFVGIVALIFLLIAYLFGRVVIHAATGRWLQRLFFSESKQSESVALLMGVAFWILVLVIPYVWPFVFAGLLVISLGLALTARYRVGWKRERQV